jgi:hypothetical protein
MVLSLCRCVVNGFLYRPGAYSPRGGGSKFFCWSGPGVALASAGRVRTGQRLRWGPCQSPPACGRTGGAWRQRLTDNLRAEWAHSRWAPARRRGWLDGGFNPPVRARYRREPMPGDGQGEKFQKPPWVQKGFTIDRQGFRGAGVGAAPTGPREKTDALPPPPPGTHPAPAARLTSKSAPTRAPRRQADKRDRRRRPAPGDRRTGWPAGTSKPRPRHRPSRAFGPQAAPRAAGCQHSGVESGQRQRSTGWHGGAEIQVDDGRAILGLSPCPAAGASPPGGLPL